MKDLMYTEEYDDLLFYANITPHVSERIGY